MKYLKTFLIGLSLLGSFSLQGAVDDGELFSLINKTKLYTGLNSAIKIVVDEVEAKEITNEQVEEGLLTQKQADLLHQEGMCAFFKKGKLMAVYPWT